MENSNLEGSTIGCQHRKKSNSFLFKNDQLSNNSIDEIFLLCMIVSTSNQLIIKDIQDMVGNQDEIMFYFR